MSPQSTTIPAHSARRHHAWQDAGQSDDDVTPEAFRAWLDQLRLGEPLQLGVTAAQTLAEARAADEV